MYDTGSTALLPFRRKSYSGFLRSEKIHGPRPGSNPRTSYPEASMITPRPAGSIELNVTQNPVDGSGTDVLMHNTPSSLVIHISYSYVSGAHRGILCHLHGVQPFLNSGVRPRRGAPQSALLVVNLPVSEARWYTLTKRECEGVWRCGKCSAYN